MLTANRGDVEGAFVIFADAENRRVVAGLMKFMADGKCLLCTLHNHRTKNMREL